MNLTAVRSLVIAPLLALAVTTAQATPITPVGATVVSGGTPWNLGGGIGELIDGDTTPGANWFGFRPLSLTSDDTIRFDLGGVFDLTSMTVWNNGGGIDGDGEGVNGFTLEFLDASLSSLGTYSDSLLDIQTGETKAFSASTVSFVDFTIDTAHMGVFSSAYAIMTEVRFDGVASSVPEPQVAALLGAGLLVSGFATRRRR